MTRCSSLTCSKVDTFVLSGSTVTSRTRTFIATRVGANYQWGIIKAHLEEEQDQTPLQKKIDDMSNAIRNVGIASAIATLIAMMVMKLYVKLAYLDEGGLFAHALETLLPES